MRKHLPGPARRGTPTGMKMLQPLGAALLPVVDLIYPPRCPLCGEGMAGQTGLCADCWTELDIPGEPACALCQRPFGLDEGLAGAVCAPCLAVPPRHDGIAAATLYNDASRRLVLAFKHGRRIGLARVLGRMMAARLSGLAGEWVIVPVPLHPRRLWSRGFNQSVLLAREIRKHRDAQLLVDGLVRRKHSAPLGGLGRTARARELAGAIAVNPYRSERIRGGQVIVVDDVLTSGATSNACVAALKRAGAERVVVACFARVLDEALTPARQTGIPNSKAPEP